MSENNGKNGTGTRGNTNHKRPKRTVENRAKIIVAAKIGASWRGCARAGGIALDTLQKWLKDDEEFYAEFEQARHEAEADLLCKASPEFKLARSYGYSEKMVVDQNVKADVTNHNADDTNERRKRLRRWYEVEYGDAASN